MQKIILYYKFVPVADPDMTMRWQRELCTLLGLKGRIIVSQHGINGTLGGELRRVKDYVKAMNQTTVFKGIQYKWSDGSADDFPRLSVKVKDELVTLEPEEEFDVFNTGKGLSPKQWHEYLKTHPDAVVLDGRNDYESEIGRFKGAITPKIKAFRDIKPELEKLDKEKPVLTYCTGDIRCEYLSSYMKHKGFKEVYHLEGGIVKYGQQFKDEGEWEGKCFVFDDRMKLGFSDAAKDIATCVGCQQPTSEQDNCANPECHDLTVICSSCQANPQVCSDACAVKAATYTA